MSGDPIYTEMIIEYSRNPSNFGKIENPQIHRHDSNPLCGDSIDLYVNTDGTKITEVKVSVSVSEKKKNTFSYSGTITIYVDATESLLFEKNKYRKTQAEDLEAKFLQQAYRSLPISKKSLSDFTLNTEFQIKYAGDFTTVVRDSESININGYPGYWSSN